MVAGFDPLPADEYGRTSWDVLVIGGERSPGKVVISGDGVVLGWDEAKSLMLNGSPLYFTGRKNARFTATFEFWKPEQLVEWANYSQRLFMKPVKSRGVSIDGKDPSRIQALGLYHPALVVVGISAAVIETVSQVTQIEDGLWSAQIAFLEFRVPTPNALKKPSSAIPGATKVNPTAQDLADAALLDAQRKLADDKAELARTQAGP